MMRNTMEMPPNPYTMERAGMNARESAVYNNIIIRTRVSAMSENADHWQALGISHI